MKDLLEFLRTRRSVSAKLLHAPGPDAAQLHQILTLGMRVPDHGKLAPWRIRILHEEGQRALGEICAQFLQTETEESTEAQLAFERDRFVRAPLVLAVLSAPQEGKIPLWEQQLSCGALCLNLMHAANALGFGANWLTEWPAFRSEIRDALGGGPRDAIAGFIYIGTASEKPEERVRPAVGEVAHIWKNSHAELVSASILDPETSSG